MALDFAALARGGAGIAGGLHTGRQKAEDRSRQQEMSALEQLLLNAQIENQRAQAAERGPAGETARIRAEAEARLRDAQAQALLTPPPPTVRQPAPMTEGQQRNIQLDSLRGRVKSILDPRDAGPRPDDDTIVEYLQKQFPQITSGEILGVLYEEQARLDAASGKQNRYRGLIDSALEGGQLPTQGTAPTGPTQFSRDNPYIP